LDVQIFHKKGENSIQVMIAEQSRKIAIDDTDCSGSSGEAGTNKSVNLLIIHPQEVPENSIKLATASRVSGTEQSNSKGEVRLTAAEKFSRIRYADRFTDREESTKQSDSSVFEPMGPSDRGLPQLESQASFESARDVDLKLNDGSSIDKICHQEPNDHVSRFEANCSGVEKGSNQTQPETTRPAVTWETAISKNLGLTLHDEGYHPADRRMAPNSIESCIGTGSETAVIFEISGAGSAYYAPQLELSGQYSDPSTKTAEGYDAIKEYSNCESCQFIECKANAALLLQAVFRLLNDTCNESFLITAI
jgi:hypothetical protein